MELYQLSDFLSIDDVADYLTEKQIHHFDLYESNDRYRLNEFIWGLIISDKITPVFHYNGFAYDLSDEQNREFLTNKAEYKETLIFSNSMLNDWNDDRVITIDGFSQKPQGWQNAPRYPTPFEQQFQEHSDLRGKTSDFYKYKSFKSDKEYILDISNYNSYLNLLIPRIQLDNIFFSDIYQKPKETPQTSGNFGTPSITIVQPSIETLNQRIKDKDSEITALNAQIRGLEKIVEQSNNEKLTAYSQKTVAKLLYALLKEHKYELGAKKGTTNDILEGLTAKHGVGISRETISKWLDRVNTLENKNF